MNPENTGKIERIIDLEVKNALEWECDRLFLTVLILSTGIYGVRSHKVEYDFLLLCFSIK